MKRTHLVVERETDIDMTLSLFNKDITEITITDSKLTDKELCKIIYTILNTKMTVKYMDLRNNNITNEGLSILLNLIGDNIEELNLSGNDIILNFKINRKFEKLKILQLQKCFFNLDYMQEFLKNIMYTFTGLNFLVISDRIDERIMIHTSFPEI